MKKATLATIKSFIRKNDGQVMILSRRYFDGMIDGSQNTGDTEFTPAIKTDENLAYTLGIQGAWFVGQSRDYFTPFEKDGLKGYEVSNSCGCFVLAVKA